MSQQNFDDFLKLVSTPVVLFDGLSTVWREWYLGGQEGRPKTDAIISRLNNDGHCNIIALAEVSLAQGNRAFDILQLLNPIMGDLTILPNDVISLWKAIYEKTQNDMMSGKQFECLPNLLKRKPNLTGGLLSQLSEEKDVFTISYISEIRCILAKSDFENQFSELLKMTASENEFEVKAAINALARLSYSNVNKSRITQVLKRFDEMEKNASEDVLFILVHAHGILLKHKNSISKKLVSFLHYDTAEIDFALSKILFLNRGGWEDENWYKEIFRTLSRTLVENKGTIENLDYIADEYMKKPNGNLIVESFLLDWLKKSNYSSGNNRFEKMFDSVAANYLKNRVELERFVTFLFNSDHLQEHSLAQQFVSMNTLWKLEPIQFSKLILKKLPMEDLVYLSRKMIAYVFQPKEALTLAYSILNKNPTDREVQELVYELLADFIGPNYLKTTILFLQAEKKKTRAKSRLGLCDRVIKKLENDIKKLENLPQLKECYSSQDKHYIAQLGHQKVMRKSMDEANSDSLISKIATTVSLKYGRGSFFAVKDEMSKPTPMIEFSTSMELARSEVSHPVYGAMKRVNLRMEKRGQ